MKTQLKIAATVVFAAIGFAATTPVLAFPSAALEFSQQTYTPPAKATAQVVAATATTRTTGTRGTTSPFPSEAMQP
jgi:hypothetical protein